MPQKIPDPRFTCALHLHLLELWWCALQTPPGVLPLQGSADPTRCHNRPSSPSDEAILQQAVPMESCLAHSSRTVQPYVKLQELSVLLGGRDVH